MSHSERVQRLRRARDRVATLIKCGEEWALPLFARLRAELEALEAQQSLLDEAFTIANNAALSRAA